MTQPWQMTGLIPFVANVGILFIIVWCISLVGRQTVLATDQGRLRDKLVIGLILGAAAGVLMVIPVQLEPGIFGDARGGPILMSGVVGGPIAAAVTTLIAAAARATAGGAGGLAGVAYILVFGLCGALYNIYLLDRTRETRRITRLLGLAVAATALSTPVILLLPEHAQFGVLTDIWPKMLVSNLIGVALLGFLFNREVRLLSLVRQRASDEAVQRATIRSTVEGVITTDADGMIDTFNPAAERLFGYAAEEAVGRKIDFLMPEDVAGKHDGYIRDYLAGKKSDVIGSGRRITGRNRHGEDLNLYISVSEARSETDDRIRFVGVVHDISDRLAQERRMNRTVEALSVLAAMSSMPGKSAAEQLSNSLDLALKHLGLEIGIVSEIRGDDYTVRQVITPDDIDLPPETLFRLQETYCDIALTERDLVAIHHMGESVHAEHPCYAAFGLESYIGTPYMVGGEIRGTVNFSARARRTDGFDEVDREFVSLIGRWVGSVLEKEEAVRELRLLSNVTEHSSEAIVITDPDEVIQYVNRAFTDITGYEAEEAVGQTPRLLASGRHAADFLQRHVAEPERPGVCRARSGTARRAATSIPNSSPSRDCRTTTAKRSLSSGSFPTFPASSSARATAQDQPGTRGIRLRDLARPARTLKDHQQLHRPTRPPVRRCVRRTGA